MKWDSVACMKRLARGKSGQHRAPYFLKRKAMYGNMHWQIVLKKFKPPMAPCLGHRQGWEGEVRAHQRLEWSTGSGKPCGLQDYIYWHLRAARPSQGVNRVRSMTETVSSTVTESGLQHFIFSKGLASCDVRPFLQPDKTAEICTQHVFFMLTHEN